MIQCMTQQGVSTVTNPALSDHMLCTGTYVTQYSLIKCSPTHIHIGIITVHKYLHWTLDGYKPTWWRPKAKQTRTYPWCFSMRVYHLLWWWMVLRNRKLVDANCQLKQTKPYSPRLNAAEREIKELKKGLGCKMLATDASRQLWDDCLELEAYIHSHSVNCSFWDLFIWKDCRHQSIMWVSMVRLDYVPPGHYWLPGWAIHLEKYLGLW